MERRVGELEHRADDLDLIRASIYDIRREMNRSNIRATVGR